MKPAYQEHIHAGEGDCFSACLASILEIPLSEVPKFRKENPYPNDMMKAARLWLAENFGLSIVTIQMEKELLTGEDLRLIGATPRTPVLAGGQSPNIEGVQHCVVGEIDEHGMNFVMTHDPNPSGKGILGRPMHLYLFVPLSVPKRINARSLKFFDSGFASASSGDSKQSEEGSNASLS
jgi:hypothetical protein